MAEMRTAERRDATAMVVANLVVCGGDYRVSGGFQKRTRG